MAAILRRLPRVAVPNLANAKALSSGPPQIKVPAAALRRLKAISRPEGAGLIPLVQTAVQNILSTRRPRELPTPEGVPNLDFPTPQASGRYGTLTTEVWKKPQYFRTGQGAIPEELRVVSELVCENLGTENILFEELAGGGGGALLTVLEEMLSRSASIRGAATRDINPYSIQAGNAAPPEELRPHVLIATGNVMSPLISIAHDGPSVVIAQRLVTVLDHEQTSLLFDNISQGLNSGDRLIMSHLLPEGDEFMSATTNALIKPFSETIHRLNTLTEDSATLEEFKDRLIDSSIPFTDQGSGPYFMRATLLSLFSRATRPRSFSPLLVMRIFSLVSFTKENL